MEKKLEILPIGSNCYYSSIACALEHLNHLEVMLGLTAFDLMFKDVESFVSLDITGGIESYLSPTDPLIFEKKPNALFPNTIFAIREAWDEFDKNYDIIGLKIPVPNNFTKFCLEYVRDNIPIILTVNVSTLADEYKHIGALIPRGRASIHMINLFNFNHDYCYVVDTQFRVAGWIKTESIKNAFYSIEEPTISVFLLSNSLKTEKELLTMHIDRSISPQLVNGFYYDGSTGLKNFIENFETIVNLLYERFGRYAFPVLSHVLYAHRLERRGCGFLYAKLPTLLEIPDWRIITALAKKSGELWYALDLNIDKSFLKGESATVFENKVKKLLSEIYITDANVLDSLNKIKG